MKQQLFSLLYVVVLAVITGCSKKNNNDWCYPKPNITVNYTAHISEEQKDWRSRPLGAIESIGRMVIELYLDGVLIHSSDLENHREDRPDNYEAKRPCYESFTVKMSAILGKSKLKTIAECNGDKEEKEITVSGDVVDIEIQCGDIYSTRGTFFIDLESTTPEERKRREAGGVPVPGVDDIQL